jgi:hypothetical protein
MENSTLENVDFSKLENLENIENDFSFLEKKEETETAKVEHSIDEVGEPVFNSVGGDESQKNSANEQPISELVEASTIIGIFDMIVSRLTSVGVSMAGYECKYTDFKLDASEQKILKQPLQNIINKRGWGNVSDESKLAILLIGMYGFKIGNSLEGKKKKKGIIKDQKEEKEINYYDMPAPNGRFSNGKPKKA